MNSIKKIHASLSISFRRNIRFLLMVFIGSAAFFSSGAEPASEFFGEGNASVICTVNPSSHIRLKKNAPAVSAFYPDKSPASISSLKPQGKINTSIYERQFSRPPPSL